MVGGSGADTFVFNNVNFGEVDRLSDFEDGVDVIQMSGVTYADLTITQNGATSEIEVGGHVIEVYGVDASDLTQDDFLFA